MSRGTTRRSAFGRRMRTVPKSSRSVTKARPSGPPMNPPLRLRSTRAIAPGRRRLPDPADDRDRPAGLPEQLGQARGLVRGQHDPGAIRPPGIDGLDQSPGTAGRQCRLAPAERIARRQGAAGQGRVLRRDRFPGQLEGPRGNQAGLPVARPEIAGRPVRGQLAGLDELGAALVGLAPQEPGGLGEVARFVEHEQRARLDVIETGRRREVGGPDLGGVTDRHGPGRIGPRASLQRRHVKAFEIGGQPLGQPCRRPAETVADGRRAAGRQQELRSRQEDGDIDRPDRPLVGRIEGAQRVDLVAEELDPDRQRQRRRKDVDDPAAPGELAATGDLGHRHVAEVEQLAQQRLLVDRDPRRSSRGLAGRSPGAIVCCSRAWTLATRTRARPLRQAASAATRAAVSSAISSLRS